MFCLQELSYYAILYLQAFEVVTLELALICSIANSNAGMLDSLYLKPPSAPLSVVKKEKRSGISGETDGKASSENSSIPLRTSFSLLSPSRPLWS